MQTTAAGQAHRARALVKVVALLALHHCCRLLPWLLQERRPNIACCRMPVVGLPLATLPAGGGASGGAAWLAGTAHTVEGLQDPKPGNLNGTALR